MTDRTADTADPLLDRLARLEAECAAARCEAAQLRGLVDRMAGVVTELRREPDGRLRFTAVSAGIRELVGLEPEECLADPMVLLGVIYPEDVPTVMASMAGEALGFVTLNYRLVHRDGRIRWVRDFTRKYLAPDGARITNTCLQDLSGPIELQEELARARDAAEAASRAKSEFLANISHEIRTPMNAVLSFAYLGLRTQAQDRQREYFGRIETAARSLLDIINDVLDLSKVEAGKLTLDPVPFSLPQVLDNLESVVGLRAQEKGLRFHIELDDAVPRGLVGDPLRLGQVLLNLGGNAVKFTERGAVTVSVRPTGTGMLRFEVRDTGIGLDPEQRGRLFMPFTQADSSTTRRFGGTGLGLSISQRMVEMMGGRIEVDSQPGVGSVFGFSIALPTADVAALAHPPRSPERIDLAGLNVLVVDDHEANLEVARGLLESAGVMVQTATSGPDGIAAAGATPDLDAIFMDMRMPGMDGLEATRRIRAAERGRRVPVIALTANAMSADRERCTAAGMDDFVSKPIDVDTLFATLARVCGRRDPAPASPLPPASATPAAQDDYAAARARVAPMPQLFERFVERFLGDRDPIARLRAELAAGQREAAAITAHTLKGTAAQLGARRLSGVAADIETRLASGAPDPVPPSLLDRLDALHEEARRELAAARPAAPAASPDHEAFERLAGCLEQQLEADDDDAWDRYEALCAAATPAQRMRLAALSAPIASLDYRRALDMLRALRRDGGH